VYWNFWNGKSWANTVWKGNRSHFRNVDIDSNTKIAIYETTINVVGVIRKFGWLSFLMSGRKGI
jgi:hypothetical protein